MVYSALLLSLSFVLWWKSGREKTGEPYYDRLYRPGAGYGCVFSKPRRRCHGHHLTSESVSGLPLGVWRAVINQAKIKRGTINGLDRDYLQRLFSVKFHDFKIDTRPNPQVLPPRTKQGGFRCGALSYSPRYENLFGTTRDREIKD